MQSKTKTVLLALAVITVLPGILAGCNTTAGVGQDITQAGAAITDSANDSKGY